MCGSTETSFKTLSSWIRVCRCCACYGSSSWVPQQHKASCGKDSVTHQAREGERFTSNNQGLRLASMSTSKPYSSTQGNTKSIKKDFTTGWDVGLESENSESREINRERYQSHSTFIIAPLCGICQHGLGLSAPDYTHIPNNQSLLLRDWLCCVHFCKYIHISSVTRLLMEQGWSKTRCGCEYFQTCRESFSHYRGG